MPHHRDHNPFQTNQWAVSEWLLNRIGVRSLHGLYIWPLSATRTALAVHLVWDRTDADAFINRLTDTLDAKYGIAAVTVQLEGHLCDRASA